MYARGPKTRAGILRYWNRKLPDSIVEVITPMWECDTAPEEQAAILRSIHGGDITFPEGQAIIPLSSTTVNLGKMVTVQTVIWHDPERVIGCEQCLFERAQKWPKNGVYLQVGYLRPEEAIDATECSEITAVMFTYDRIYSETGLIDPAKQAVAINQPDNPSDFSIYRADLLANRRGI